MNETINIDKKYIHAKDLMTLLGVSEYMAYKIVRDLNKELAEEGYIILKGKIPINYLFNRLGISKATS
jgi:transcriptional antiterminator